MFVHKILSFLLPEILMIAFASCTLLLGAFFQCLRMRMCQIGIVFFLALLGIYFLEDTVFILNDVEGGFVLDTIAIFGKILILLCATGLLVVSLGYFRNNRAILFNEYFFLFTMSVVGAMLIVSSSNFLSLYISLELSSLVLYMLVCYNKCKSSIDAGMKYFVSGALMSGVMLYGISLVYGATGSLDYSVILGANAIHGTMLLPMVGMVCIISAMLFKLASFPFHMWLPDVYEGALPPVAGFVAVIPKIACAIALYRILLFVFPAYVDQWRTLLVILAILSMLFGSVLAVVQDKVWRMLAYSSVTHAGYIILAIASATQNMVGALFLYLAVYVVTILSVFAILSGIYINDRRVIYTDELSGLHNKFPVMAACLAVALFSMAGVPPLFGFFAKYLVFHAAMESGLFISVISGVISSIISAFIYLKVIRNMYFASIGVGNNMMASHSLLMRLLILCISLLLAILWFPFFGYSDYVIQLASDVMVLS